jgi:hypothetical protein
MIDESWIYSIFIWQKHFKKNMDLLWHICWLVSSIILLRQKQKLLIIRDNSNDMTNMPVFLYLAPPLLQFVNIGLSTLLSAYTKITNEISYSQNWISFRKKHFCFITHLFRKMHNISMIFSNVLVNDDKT